MPFQHSEDLDDQQRSLALFTALGDDYQLGYAKKHHDVIERFGRFPHRNAILGRTAAAGRGRGRRRGALVMALVEAARFYDSLEAGAAQSRLAAEGIDSFLFDTRMTWQGVGFAIPVRLMVDEDDLARRAARCSASEMGPERA